MILTREELAAKIDDITGHKLTDQEIADLLTLYLDDQGNSDQAIKQ